MGGLPGANDHLPALHLQSWKAFADPAQIYSKAFAASRFAGANSLRLLRTVRRLTRKEQACHLPSASDAWQSQPSSTSGMAVQIFSSNIRRVEGGAGHLFLIRNRTEGYEIEARHNETFVLARSASLPRRRRPRSRVSEPVFIAHRCRRHGQPTFRDAAQPGSADSARDPAGGVQPAPAHFRRKFTMQRWFKRSGWHHRRETISSGVAIVYLSAAERRNVTAACAAGAAGRS